MKPEDLDRLFNERLGNRTPTPSADLWNRLQNRIEEELPVKEEKKPIMMWARTYAAAAAVTVLLSAGVVFYKVQQEAVAPTENLAQVEQPAVGEINKEPVKADKWINKRVAVANEDKPEAPVSAGESIAAVEAQKEQITEIIPVQKSVKPAGKKVKSSGIKFNNKLVAANSSKKEMPSPVQEQIVMPETPVAFASVNANMNATPVEIIIKRSVTTSTPEVAAIEEPVSEFNKKKSLVKNIFKQVKNLSNGEQVNLEAVGFNADRIALETQIGKQKLSKVIHL